MINRGRLIFRKSGVNARFFHPATDEYVLPNKLSPCTYTKDSPQFKILSHAIDNTVTKFGFSERAIIEAMKELKIENQSTMLSAIGSSNSPSFLHSSPSVMELLKFNLVLKRYRMIEGLDPLTMQQEELPSLESLLLKRLEMDIPIGKHISAFMSQLVIPGPFLLDSALPELHRLADDMIYFSNEKDHHDFAWYSKRLGVSSAYISSKLFMAQDNSCNYKETLQFAKDKLEKVMRLGDYYNNTEEYAWYVLLNSVNMVKSRMSRA
ncbi:hypothetical protein TPHA_0F02980 [Tetrapisispora phaffii CBS 4417]|uniref:Ubiquinone biosynthesis protein n=1 Tax=Tetrapisispora phaffii (strain ATCC 24235 / CBS 4417 / NBRC 1672 / NRRL Y-8282 / UCD 70-5) TaxID=1071381 RepID=G8BUJ3_TETPH|nr:hypothetical protein TPHA_0F02980 [Tetrapisispora phaffii CBS 4417]CCE63779.1 hypothetical protein TPHA_0F02980 [Tetrapisispora phaffii CBS 4417]